MILRGKVCVQWRQLDAFQVHRDDCKFYMVTKCSLLSFKLQSVLIEQYMNWTVGVHPSLLVVSKAKAPGSVREILPLWSSSLLPYWVILRLLYSQKEWSSGTIVTENIVGVVKVRCLSFAIGICCSLPWWAKFWKALQQASLHESYGSSNFAFVSNWNRILLRNIHSFA